MDKVNKAIKFFEDEIVRLRKAPEINGCEMTPEWIEMLQIYNTALEAIKKQMLTKPIHSIYTPKNSKKRHIVYCGVCGKFAQRVCFRDKYCRECGTKIDWSESK